MPVERTAQHKRAKPLFAFVRAPECKESRVAKLTHSLSGSRKMKKKIVYSRVEIFLKIKGGKKDRCLHRHVAHACYTLRKKTT